MSVCSWCAKELEDSERVIALNEQLYNVRDLCEPTFEYICMNCYRKGSLHIVIYYFDGVSDGVSVTYNEKKAQEWIQEFLDLHGYESWQEYEDERMNMPKHEIDHYIVPTGEIV